MRTKLAVVLLLCLAALTAAPAARAAEPPARVLIVAGPSNHPPGSHEVAAGARLLEHCLEHMTNLPGVQADVVSEWPSDPRLLEQAATIVFIGDTFPPARFPDSPNVMAQLGRLIDQGRGIVCLHYATGLRAEDVTDSGDHPLLRWLGGYFATRNKHHQSIARIYEAATITPAAPQHPVSRGWKPFTIHDEPYIHNYFGPNGNQPAANVTALATSMLPPESPKPEIVSWCVERADGGRGYAIVMPHFYRNWAHEDLRRFILNGIVWTAKLEVPAEGVTTAAPDLAAFNPESIEPKPRAKKAK